MSLKLLQMNYGSDESETEEDESDVIMSSDMNKDKTMTTVTSKYMKKGEAKDENFSPVCGDQVCVSGYKKCGQNPMGVAKKLPLPDELQNMFLPSSGADEDDNSEKLGGRVRSFPHVRGNWASFVHIPLNDSESVVRQIGHIKLVIDDFPDLGIHFCEDVHLSLSKTVVFRHHWIDSFTAVLKHNLNHISRFNLVFQEFQTYVNEEKTRTFVAMNINTCSQLNRLVKASDAALAEYDLDTYYEDPSFHVSLCWTLGDKSQFLKKSVLPLMNSKWRTHCENEPELQFQSVDTIWFKTGNRLCNFQLNCM